MVCCFYMVIIDKHLSLAVLRNCIITKSDHAVDMYLNGTRC